jgi:O-antigen/teichoic acid export membrane protein
MTTVCALPPKHGQRDLAAERQPLRAATTAVQGAYALVDQVLVSAASFAAGLMVGQVSKEQLGIYSLGVATFWLLAGITNALVWTPYTARAAHLSPRRHTQYRAVSAVLSMAMGLMLAAAAAVCGVIASVVGTEATWLAPFLWACAPLAIAMTIREHVRRVCVADFRGADLLLIDIPFCVLSLMAIFGLWHFELLTANTALLVLAVAALPAGLYAVGHTAAAKSIRWRIIPTFVANWQYGKWLLLVAAAWLASDTLLRWLLLYLGGPEELGSFAGVFMIVAVVNPLLLAMTSFARSVASRRLASGSRQQLTRRTLATTGWASLFATVSFVLLALFGDDLTRWTLGAEYVDSQLMVLLALAICLEGVAVPIEATFIALESGRLLSQVAATRLAVSLVVGAVLIPWYGAHGMALALVARSVAAFCLYLVGIVLTHRHSSDASESLLSTHSFAGCDTSAANPKIL